MVKKGFKPIGGDSIHLNVRITQPLAEKNITDSPSVEEKVRNGSIG
jgi:hypothetical protein